MKTQILILVLSLLTGLGSSASNCVFYLADEEYVDDIPFDTEIIASRFFSENFADNDPTNLPEESYVNDIPFNTKKIACDFLVISLCKKYFPEDEDCVNDIPFNTEEIASNHLLNCYEYSLEDEAYVDDIPFNTLCHLFNYATYYGIKESDEEGDPFILVINISEDEKYIFFKADEFRENLKKCFLNNLDYKYSDWIKINQHEVSHIRAKAMW